MKSSLKRSAGLLGSPAAEGDWTLCLPRGSCSIRASHTAIWDGGGWCGMPKHPLAQNMDYKSSQWQQLSYTEHRPCARHCVRDVFMAWLTMKTTLQSKQNHPYCTKETEASEKLNKHSIQCDKSERPSYIKSCQSARKKLNTKETEDTNREVQHIHSICSINI